MLKYGLTGRTSITSLVNTSILLSLIVLMTLICYSIPILILRKKYFLKLIKKTVYFSLRVLQNMTLKLPNRSQEPKKKFVSIMKRDILLNQLNLTIKTFSKNFVKIQLFATRLKIYLIMENSSLKSKWLITLTKMDSLLPSLKKSPFIKSKMEASFGKSESLMKKKLLNLVKFFSLEIISIIKCYSFLIILNKNSSILV